MQCWPRRPRPLPATVRAAPVQLPDAREQAAGGSGGADIDLLLHAGLDGTGYLRGAAGGGGAASHPLPGGRRCNAIRVYDERN